MGRPRGLSALSIFEVIVGSAMVTIGVAAASGGSLLTVSGLAIASVFAVELLLYGAVSIVAGYGMWKGRYWAWILMIGLYAIETFFAAIYVFFVVLGSILTLAFDLIVLWYLWKPHVRSFFRISTSILPPT